MVFRTDTKISNLELAKKIENAIFKKYNFEVPVIIRSLEALEKIVTQNPFLKNKDFNTEKLHVTFLSETPLPANVKNIKITDYSPDKFIVIESEVFLHCPESYGETKLSNNFFEKKLKVSATTRNWKTVNKLLEIANNN